MHAVTAPNVITLSETGGSSIDPVAALQADFALVNVGGPICVIELSDLDYEYGMQTAPELKLHKRHDADVLMHRRLQLVGSPAYPQEAIRAFYTSPKTKIFNRIAFSPLRVAPDTLNLWHGPTTLPSPGKWLTIQEFLVNVICGGHLPSYEYLLSFVAHMLQRPEDKPGVMFWLRGGQGTGKGTLFRMLHRIWGATTLQVTRVEQVTGNFNSCLERSYVVLLDEAIFAGDNKSADALKSLVTEPTLSIEAKFQPRRMIQSLHRLFAATNAEHIGRVESDDRRMIVMTVSDCRKGHHGYWDTVHSALEGHELQAFVFDMIQRDIRSFNPRVRPQRPELVEQKLKSLQGLDRWWLEVLLRGHIRRLPLPEQRRWDTSIFVSTDDMLDLYRAFTLGSRTHQPATSSDLAVMLNRLCESARKCRRTTQGESRRGYDLPMLKTARANFEKAIGGAVDWGDDGPT